MKSLFLIYCMIYLFFVIFSVPVTTRDIFALDERWVCNIKKSCVECLRLPHCSWCKTYDTCFSNKMQGFEEYCNDAVIEYKDAGLDLEVNAECACAGGVLEGDCSSPGQLFDVECSGRGKCECGRCVCDTMPDPEHPSKTIMGEYCELDNFSCDGPECSEGPYAYSESTNDMKNYFVI